MLLILSGIMWIAVGILLLHYVLGWLGPVPAMQKFIFGGSGILLALLIHHFGFLRVVDKNLGRILPMNGRPCVFSFMSWKSYLIVLVMVSMGILLRHSALPKPWLSLLYTGIGLALILSSIRYFRVLLSRWREL